MPARQWNYREYATARDPAHKSQLNNIVGDFGCPRRFRYEMDERAARGLDGLDERDTVPGKAAAGTAAHETIARALSSPILSKLLAGEPVKRAHVERAFAEELAREVGGRAVQWYDKHAPEEIIAERVDMICGVLNTLHRYVAEVLLVEPGFIVCVDGFWLSGHIDLVFRPRSDPTRIAMADWKTGAHKPHPIELDHGWEAGIYAAALYQGYLFPREQVRVDVRSTDGRTRARCGRHEVEHWSRYIAERVALERAMIDFAVGIDKASDIYAASEVPGDAQVDCVTYGEYPAEVWHVHAADFVPYKKAGKKAVKRREDLAWYGYESPQTPHVYAAGEHRGPGWLPVQVTEYDLPRLAHRLRAVIGSIRMGRFIDQVGERCARCPYSRDCLTSGYSPRANSDDARAIERALRAGAANDNSVAPAAVSGADFDIDD